MKKVRWGLLSTANINRRLIQPLKSSSRGQLVAVASRAKEVAAAYAAQWEIPFSFGSYTEMLESGSIDAVYIGLPNHLHAEWSIRAMQAGVHVLCEKPFAISLGEVDAVRAASRRYDRVIAEAFMYRHHPQTKIAGEWVRNGRLGDICVVQSSFHFKINERDDIRLVPEYGRGSLWDVGVYPLSFAQFIMGGPPRWVASSQWIGASGVDETFAGLMHYEGNRLAHFDCGFRSLVYTFTDIIGTKGRLTINRPFIGQQDKERRMTFYPEEGEPEEILVPDQELYSGEVEDMNAAILDGSAPYLSLDETRDHVRTALALYESARQGQIVFL